MIAIKKCDCPEILDSATRDLSKNVYNKEPVIRALRESQGNKCAYCERDLDSLESTEKEVDHFVPPAMQMHKDDNGSINWNSVNNWENLFYSCRTCNNKKRQLNPYDDENNLVIVKPTDIDPENHITFFIDDPIIAYKELDKSEIGCQTIRTFHFHEFNKRPTLYECLSKYKVLMFSTFNNLFYSRLRDNEGKCRDYIKALQKMTSADSDHSLFARVYLTKLIRDFNEKIDKVNESFESELQNIVIERFNQNEERPYNTVSSIAPPTIKIAKSNQILN